MNKRWMAAAMLAMMFASITMAGDVREFRLEEARTIYPAYRTWDLVVTDIGRREQTDLLTPNGVRGTVSRVSDEQIRVLNKTAASSSRGRAEPALQRTDQGVAQEGLERRSCSG